MKRDASLESLEGPVHHGSKHARERNVSPSTVVSIPSTTNGGSSPRFFILDWLEKLNAKEMDQANKVIEENRLVTPKKTKKHIDDENPADWIPKNIGSTTRTPLTPPRHPSINPSRPMPSTFRAKKEAVGNGWNAKGVQKAKCENWEDALACWEKALEIRLQVFGDVHKDVANTLNNMGVALGRLERHGEAMELLERALKVRTAIYGKGHLEIAATLHNIGNVLQQMDDYSGALKCFLETKRIQEELLGDRDIQVARTLNAIGHLHFECAQAYKKALEAYTEARDVFLRAGINEGNEELQNTYLDIAEVEQLVRTDWNSSCIRNVHFIHIPYIDNGQDSNLNWFHLEARVDFFKHQQDQQEIHAYHLQINR